MVPTTRRPRLSVRLGSMAGIDIRIHATFLILVALVAAGSTVPGSPGLAGSLVWLVALFSCVVIHELAHSLVARRHGIPVTEIELLPIGGISKMAKDPDDPGVELRIAAAGPAASVALAGAFATAGAVTGATLWPPTLYGGGFLARLTWVNLLLAGFNLLPALPLDGGRVFRAALAEHMSRQRATHLAARVARVLAAVMFAFGIFVNVWLLIIAAFVYLGSRAEEVAAEDHALPRPVAPRAVPPPPPPPPRRRATAHRWR